MSVRHCRPISGLYSPKKKLLASLVLTTGGIAAGFFEVAAEASNHGLFRRNMAAQTVMIAPRPAPILTTSSYTVLMPTMATSYVMSPVIQVIPTTTWHATTSLLMPMEATCLVNEVASPPAALSNVPELQEIPKPAKPESSPQEKPPVGSGPKEPPLNPNAVSPPIGPEASKPAKPESKPPETKPVTPKVDNKIELPISLPGEVNPTPPPAKVSSPKPAAAAEFPANESKPAATVKPLEKSVDAPSAKPAEKPKDSLIPPPAAEIPLPDSTVPKLEPTDIPPPAPAAAATSNEITKSAPSGPADKPPVTLPAPKPSDLPPSSGAIELPSLPDSKPSPSATPVIPLPEIPPPANGELLSLPSTKADLLPVPDLVDEIGGKPSSPKTIQPGGEKSPETSTKQRDSLRPVISGTTKMTLPKPELGIQVKSQRTGSIERDVRVLFREPKSAQIKFDTRTDLFGKAKLDVPEGRWEVLVESPGGTLYVLGELISANGKLTTASGRSLPILEINR